MNDNDGIDVVDGRGEWANPPIIECEDPEECGIWHEPEVWVDASLPRLPKRTDEINVTLVNSPKVFSEADLLRLAGQLEAAIEQGWVFKRYLPCGDREHRHSWRFTAWLCNLVKGG